MKRIIAVVAVIAILHNFMVTNTVGYAFDLTPFNVFVGPGETMSASCAATDSGRCGVALTWDEVN